MVTKTRWSPANTAAALRYERQYFRNAAKLSLSH
jgi:hypothetical protein